MERINIIWVVLDTVRNASTSLASSGKNTTPHLRTYSDDATVYTRAVSPAPWTIPSHASFFTGLYPSEHGTHGAHPYVVSTVPWLPEILKGLGYTTICLTSNMLLSEVSGFHRGFSIFWQAWQKIQQREFIGDTFKDPKFLSLSKKGMIFSLLKEIFVSPQGASIAKAALNYYFLRHRYAVTRDTTPVTKRCLKKAKEYLDTVPSPYFIFINLMQAHSAYNPPQDICNELGIKKVNGYINVGEYYSRQDSYKTFDWKGIRNMYEAEIYYQDRLLAHFLMHLKKRKDYDNTLVVITSDHGEHLGEHGHYNHLFTLYNELIHVPLVVKYPHGTTSHGEERRLCQTNDLFATIHDIIGIIHTSKSSLSLLSPERRRDALSQLISVKFSLEKLCKFDGNLRNNFKYNRSLISLWTDDNWKYIKGSDGGIELYHFKDKEIEDRNLANDARYQDIKRDMSSRIEDMSRNVNFTRAINQETEYTESVKRQLEAMGYM